MAAGARLTVEGTDQLSDGQHYFFVVNHKSAIDIPVMAAALRGRPRFMVKHTLFRIPILGSCMRLHGFVRIDRSNTRKAKESIDRMVAQLERRPMSLLVFAEGTRSADDDVKPFKHGSMNVCQRTGLSVVPLAIAGSGDIHRARVFRVNSGPVQVSIGRPIPANEVANHTTAELARITRDEVARLYEDACLALSTRHSSSSAQCSVVTAQSSSDRGET
jgi:1-acyl-sn-glycerol-3-phosphate acyltransferase